MFFCIGVILPIALVILLKLNPGRVLDVSMGHNDMDYGKTNKTLSYTFGSEMESKFIINSPALVREFKKIN